MKYVLAFIKLFIGIIQALFDWAIYLPYALFTIPVRKWNETIYGKPQRNVAFEIVEMKNGKVKIILPNGEVIYADKKVQT